MDERFNELQRGFISEMRLLNRPEDRIMTLRLNKLEDELNSAKKNNPPGADRESRANPPAPRRQSARSRKFEGKNRSFAKATSFSRLFAWLTTRPSATREIVR